METSPTLRIAPNDEAYWSSVRQNFQPMYVNTQLVNSRRGATPKLVRERIRSLVDLALSYELDEHEPFRNLKESGSSLTVRRALADYFGGSADEIALTRNAMEGIATVINGIALLPGDEILATRFCYDSNLAIIRQREVREGVVLKFVDIPFGAVSNDAIIATFEAAFTKKTRLVTFPHIVSRIGLVLPVRQICKLANARGAFTLVDGAHSAGHIDFRLEELNCDSYATCLHKWMHGPRGTGFLYMRKDKISTIWPLFASWSNRPANSIEKFEEVGTVFKALPVAIHETLAFNKAIGQKEKSARLHYLRDRWARPLSAHCRIQLLTDLDALPGTGFAGFTVDGLAPTQFAEVLLRSSNIHVGAFAMEADPSLSGVFLSPALSNTVQEIDRFVMEATAILDRI